MNNRAIEANKNQFLSTYHMLRKMVEVCPDDVWAERFHDVPFWYQIYHCVFFVDFWFREDYTIEFVPLMKFPDNIPPEFETRIPEETFISRTQMNEYLDVLEPKIQQFFDGLTDEDLSKSIVPGNEYFTYTDAIVCQSRHIMYNMGYLNGILRDRNLEESDWWAYNERE